MPWLPAEARVADRFVRALVAGRYASALEVVPHCKRALEQLRARALERGESLPLRSHSAVRCRINKQARSAGRPARPAHLPWLPAEARVLDQFVRALLTGRYVSAREAAPHCQEALDQLRARANASGESLPTRSSRAVWCRISELARDIGRPLRRVRYTREESQLFSRYARRLASGRYATVADAARACFAAHRQLKPSPPLRPFYGIYQTIETASCKLGRTPVFRPMSAKGVIIMRQYAKAVADGRYPDVVAALPDIRADLPDKRSASCIARRVRELARALGWSPAHVRWSDAENGIAERFAKAVVAGVYVGPSAAVDDCLAALRATGMRSRSRNEVRYRLSRRLRSLGWVPGDKHWSPAELEVVNRFARRVAEGGLRATAATELCRQALAEAGFPLRATDDVMHKLNTMTRTCARRPCRLRWTEAENKACDSWIDWYDRHRTVRRYRPRTMTIDGLLEDTQRIGSQRTRSACAAHLRIRRLRKYGLA